MIVASWLFRTHDRFFQKGMRHYARRCSPSNAMTEHENKTAKPLVHLGITRPEELSALFPDLRGRFDAACSCAHDDSSLNQFPAAWLGPKSPVLTLITYNCLKPTQAA